MLKRTITAALTAALLGLLTTPTWAGEATVPAPDPMKNDPAAEMTPSETVSDPEPPPVSLAEDSETPAAAKITPVNKCEAVCGPVDDEALQAAGLVLEDLQYGDGLTPKKATSWIDMIKTQLRAGREAVLACTQANPVTCDAGEAGALLSHFDDQAEAVRIAYEATKVQIDHAAKITRLKVTK